MRHHAWFVLALSLFLPAGASAAQPRCPLPVDSCLARFGRMRERPWLGVFVEMDSTGGRIVRQVVPDGPAARAGIKPGDVLESIDGQAMPVFFAGRAGWKDGDRWRTVVRRGGRERALAMTAAHIPEEYFARMVGEHMLEAHLAYADTGGHDLH